MNRILGAWLTAGMLLGCGEPKKEAHKLKPEPPKIDTPKADAHKTDPPKLEAPKPEPPKTGEREIKKDG